jgi:hypothetical protein
MRIKVSMGFFAFGKRPHPLFARKTRDDLVHYRIPEGFFVIELVVRNPERASPGRPPTTIALACAPDRAVERRCISGCFWLLHKYQYAC